MELKKIKELVTKLLSEKPELRASDDLLYLEVLKKVHPHWSNARITTNIENISIGEFFTMRKSAKLPNFESVRRSRQKAQEEHPELKPCEKVLEARKRNEENFYNFAVNQGELF